MARFRYAVNQSARLANIQLLNINGLRRLDRLLIAGFVAAVAIVLPAFILP